ncbi:MAG: hypothetical protein JSV09_03655 [Thermoplasmata archaeon]|nr:MAG: hypothetical protein JSV09_03655 [Thermoplasmata archaeon]
MSKRFNNHFKDWTVIITFFTFYQNTVEHTFNTTFYIHSIGDTNEQLENISWKKKKCEDPHKNCGDFE